ncbi:MAG TPA: hypothetical protein VNS12_00950 [Pelagibacterium sp.]|uniref:hypothetical protein n=1 Tax=Pelagibacterium sp. TaxID=1967288 RepID=UPI002CA3609A|nr:hypothetical protein [Pelagibacterium sp.]HWJ86622.1 hypothetical protein [Pelagibacterium sp.]
MAHKQDSVLIRQRPRRIHAAISAPEPEWRENLRDFGLMLSGIYQDLRGDAREGYSYYFRRARDGRRKRGARARHLP